jgi:3-oxoacyl-[acyl-carrier-protein] synthase III
MCVPDCVVTNVIRERRMSPDTYRMLRRLSNLDRYGNTAAASVPICLHEALAEGRTTDGDLVMLVAFGTGFSWGATLLRW